jgi:hypothetical protein
MLGLIPKVLMELLDTEHGGKTALEIKRRAGCPAEQEFRINEVYDDQLWLKLVIATCEVLQYSTDKLEEEYARYFLKDAQQRWPAWFKMSKNARQFLERHPAVHNNFADAVRDPASREQITDKFRIENLDDKLVTHYRSPNRHCYLYICLAREVLKLHGEEASIEERQCIKRGDSECEIWVTWAKGELETPAG